MTWTAERIAELKRLWAAGTPTAEIGRRLGVSKNAVVGKAHRLGLAARPSPIKRNDVTLISVVVDGDRPCQWPFGDPSADGFHFCGAPVLVGKPYCPAHCDLAYVRADRRTDRRTDRAA